MLSFLICSYSSIGLNIERNVITLLWLDRIAKVEWLVCSGRLWYRVNKLAEQMMVQSIMQIGDYFIMF